MNDGAKISIWLDAEGDRLTVNWGFRDGYYIKTDDPRVMARVDLAGNVLGFQAESLETLKDTRLEAGVPGNWYDQLDKTRGSRPRCVLLMDGEREDVAARLTKLVNVPGVAVSPDDQWEPYGKPVWQEGKWHTMPTMEIRAGELSSLLPFSPGRREGIKNDLLHWWLAAGYGRANTPNWDIASSCTIQGQPGLLLVEAKAHLKELRAKDDRCRSSNQANLDRIGNALAAANAALQSATGKPWRLSRDRQYQLSNRFAWAWKLADLGIPVILLYLGFLNAQEFQHRAGDDKIFATAEEWESEVESYCREKNVVDNAAWGRWLQWPDKPSTAPLLPLLRVYDQPFHP